LISPKGGCAVAETTYISPTQLAEYEACQRKHDYGSVQEVGSPDETRLYMNQGLTYHETIEAVCEATDEDDDASIISQRASDFFDEKWNEYLEPEEYESQAHQRYQYEENRTAIESFFDPEDGDGIEHARQSVATEIWIETEHNGIGLHGKADNVLRDGNELHVIDYKRNIEGVLGSWSGDRLVEHLEHEAYEAGRVKNAFLTAAYIEGVKETELYNEGMSVRFSFYGLLHSTDVESTPDGYRISVDSNRRETTEAYEEYNDTVWSLIQRAHEGIKSGYNEPEPFDLINEEACPSCEYKDICTDYLAQEVQR
jgi:putative RecB family exonuclease